MSAFIRLEAFLFLFLLSTVCLAGGTDDVRYSQEDVRNFNEVMDILTPLRDSSLNELVIVAARHFIGTKYVASSIEMEPEMLTVSTTKTDCMLFVEMCLAMSLTAKGDSPDFASYCDNLRKLRYRDGIVDGYASRLHYSSEWIRQGESRGVFEEITGDLGGLPYSQKFNFMSAHPGYYRQLKDNPAETARIREVERNLEKYEYRVIPKDKLGKAVSGIKTGDIVCFDQNTAGLDIAHVAFALREGDTLTFIHASSKAGKVVVNSVPLLEYTRGIKSHDGLRVIRLK